MLEKTYSLMLSGDSWPGGKDEGIEITASDLAAGIALARQNLRLAKELKRDDEVFANRPLAPRRPSTGRRHRRAQADRQRRCKVLRGSVGVGGKVF